MTPTQLQQFQRGLDAIRAAERGPTRDDLAGAPILDYWRVMIDHRLYPMPVLWGEVTGHPTLGTDLITTSRLVALEPDAGWARSVKRWYRLARPFAELEAELTRQLGHSDASPGTFWFDLPGFAPIDDPAALDRILTEYIALMRRVAGIHGIE